MSEKKDFGFCPRCGALMQNGVCTSCGRNQRSVDATLESPEATAAKKKKKTIIIVCAAAVVLVIALAAAFFLILRNVAGMVENMSGYNYYDSYDDYEDYDDYVPDGNDSYYKEITNSIRSDLDYKVYWERISIDADDSDSDGYFYATYPILKGEGAALTTINEQIRQVGAALKEAYEASLESYSLYAYVTYMDEETISVVFEQSTYGDSTYSETLSAMNFHVASGEQIAYSQMAEVNQDLALRFRSQDKIQNGGVEYVQNSTDEELLEILQDPDSVVMFYSPVGLEVGFNYDRGWVTVTLKKQSL
jgi:hypothetical protein